MGSTNPNRFLPSQWFKAAQHIKPPHQVSDSDLSRRTSLFHSQKINKSESQQSVAGPSSAEELLFPSNNFDHMVHPHQHSYFLRMHKPRNPAFSKKFLHTSSSKNKPYIPKKCSPAIDLNNSITSNGPSFSYSKQADRVDSNINSSGINKSEKSNLSSTNPKKMFLEQSKDLSDNSDQMSMHSIDINRNSKDNVTAESFNPEMTNYCAGRNLSNDDNQVSTHPANFSKSNLTMNETLSRHWISMTNSIRHHSIYGSFSIMSYNILSQTLLEVNDYLYRECHPHVLPWSFRWSNLKNELEKFDVDILCLQEVEEIHYHEVIKPWLKSKGYIHSYKRRTGQDVNKPDGVLTACRSEKFQIVAAIPVEYFRPFHYLTQWHNVGLIVMLKMLENDKPDNPYICVANTHLVYNPNRGDVKLVQLVTLFAEIDQVLNKYARKIGHLPPLIICGDFNSTPYSPLFNLVSKGKLYYGGLLSKLVSGQKVYRTSGKPLPDCLIPSELNVSHECTYFEDDEKLNPIKNHILTHNLGPLSSTGHRHEKSDATTTQDKGVTVDYIFYSDSRRSNSNKDLFKTFFCKQGANTSNKETFGPILKKYDLRLMLRLSASNGQDIQRAHGLPNNIHSSDHIPVVANFLVLN